MTESSFEDHVMHVIGYIVLFLLVSVFLTYFVISESQKQNDLGSPADQTNTAQKFAQPALKQLSFDFSNNTTLSNSYQKNKSINFKKMLLANALKKNDLNTLVKIYQKEPTIINKTYVFACVWNTRYDKTNTLKYARSLIYYNRHFTKRDQELISPFLKEIIDTCISDPTGHHTLNEFLRTKSKTQIVWPK